MSTCTNCTKTTADSQLDKPNPKAISLIIQETHNHNEIINEEESVQSNNFAIKIDLNKLIIE